VAVTDVLFFFLGVWYCCIGEKNGNTALHFSSDNGHLEVMRLLLEKGADIKDGNKVSAVRAVGYGDGN
jgi:hypothetical protein